ncbi:hypothetical protein GK047_19645 [Paenibacillus sp. SYP-B3998]|uniref:DUF3168 domain-containing protein n=1 Tax=Paenibacillus sp. SYP-B3998 TaxID=2678564 RepID=A0A6G4A1P7_9BACL|nr:hypothetical protein [Paenibacillus sp. SYP-B3998]NEW08218.1 hypothetical protein [Paenibacillus sp. SYP-B3998]
MTSDTLLTVIFNKSQLSRSNAGYRETTLSFNILCHIDNWQLDRGIRPYSILGEIDKLFNNEKVIGIGKVQFDRARFMTANEKYAGYRLDYTVINFR